MRWNRRCARFNLLLRRPIEARQCVSIRFIKRLAAAGIEAPVGSVGDSDVNALAETINGRYAGRGHPSAYAMEKF